MKKRCTALECDADRGHSTVEIAPSAGDGLSPFAGRGGFI